MSSLRSTRRNGRCSEMSNRVKMRKFLFGMVLAVAGVSAAWAGPETEAFGPAQAAADAMREAAGADMAFLAAGMVKSNYDPKDLSSLLQFPTDEIAIVSLKGSQIRQALERSVSLYPAPNTGFLQLSGLEASFSKSAAPEHRVTSVTVGGSKLDDFRTYTVAMPASLARGGLGYFKVWDRNAITKTLDGRTMESVLQGKAYTGSSPRWSMGG